MKAKNLDRRYYRRACTLYRALHSQSYNLIALDDKELRRLVGDEIDLIVRAFRRLCAASN
jgi:hypothetical protein